MDKNIYLLSQHVGKIKIPTIIGLLKKWRTSLHLWNTSNYTQIKTWSAYLFILFGAFVECDFRTSLNYMCAFPSLYLFKIGTKLLKGSENSRTYQFLSLIQIRRYLPAIDLIWYISELPPPNTTQLPYLWRLYLF